MHHPKATILSISILICFACSQSTPTEPAKTQSPTTATSQSPVISEMTPHNTSENYETRGASDPETLMRAFHEAARTNNTAAARDLLTSYAICQTTQITKLQETCRRTVREVHNKKLPELLKIANSNGELESITIHSRKDHLSGIGAALQIKTFYRQDPKENIGAVKEALWHAILFNERVFLTAKIDPPTVEDTKHLELMNMSAQKQITKLNQFIMIFQGKENRPPKNLTELATMLKANIGVDISVVDPWGQPLQMEEIEGLTEIFSSGPDKIPHTSDDITVSNEHHHEH